MGDYDSVNLFNGNLTVNLPLGPTFTPGGNLSYSFHLVYNGNAWAIVGDTPPEAIPNRFSNAGLGWKVTLGELVAPRDPAASDVSSGGNWVYIASDGSEHPFYRTLHSEEIGTGYSGSDSTLENTVAGYTHDGSYLRLIRGTRMTNGNPHPCGGGIFGFCSDWIISYSIEAPDGNTHRFEGQLDKQTTKGPPTVEEDSKLSYRLASIVDRFGNYLHIFYPDPLTWTITDGTAAAGDTRTHTVHFINQAFYDYAGQSTAHLFIESLDLAAFNGQTATYRFAYSDYDTISKNCYDSYGGETTKTRFLNSLTHPDGSAFSMDYNRIELSSVNTPHCSFAAGHLLMLALPTGGKIQYTVEERTFPGNPDGDGHQEPTWQTHSMGVATRTLFDAANTSVGLWRYSSALTNAHDVVLPHGGTRREYKAIAVTVHDPLDQTTISYFTADHFGGDSSCYPGSLGNSEYGMPFTRAPGTTIPGGLFLSNEVYDGACTIPVPQPGNFVCNVSCVDAGNQPLQPIRSTYVRYEQDGTSALHDEERRVTKGRTVFNNDSGCASPPCYVETDFDGFDGLGHYRTVTHTSNFPATLNRVTTTHYNARGGTYVVGTVNNPNAYMIAPNSPWLLGVYDFQTTTENQIAATTEFCFNATTAFLERKRTVRSGDRAKDLLATYAQTGGNVTAEAYFGGDSHALASGFVTCTSAPTTPDYRLTHTYTAGSLESTQYDGVAFKSADMTIDHNTGLTSTSKDVSGQLSTSYKYDTMQRLTEVRPPGEAWTKYTYTLGSSTSLSILCRPIGSDESASPETSSYLYFDSFGRLVLSKEKLPEGWATTKTTYDLLGRVVSTSMPEFRTLSSSEAFTPAHATTTTYDRFDRPRIITSPDLASTTFSYTGNRETKRTVCVSALQTQAPCPTGEFPFTTIETVDGHGRLSTVIEPIGTGVTTTYGYDVGNRLTTVSTNATEGLQHRTFTYDLGGLLISAQHPEKGINGYGAVSYPEYDARGHLRHRIDGVAQGSFDTTFVYNSAERLTKVRDLDPATNIPRAPRDLKVFFYGIDNATNDPRLGKLQTATRHNYQPSLGGDIAVAETYTYGGPNGRISARTTSVSGTFSNNTFSLGQEWNDLGNALSTTYPSNAALTTTPARTVEYAYTNGLLTGVTGYTNTATSISRVANGMVTRIEHLNGESEDWSPDPNGMPRPASIRIKGNAGLDTPIGPYTYDGAGNIKQIGDSAGVYTKYLYDGAGRMIKSTAVTPSSSAIDQTWDYDSFGNRIETAQSHQFDPNNDGSISAMDIFYLVNFLYMSGPPPAGPAGLLSGDSNGDGSVNPMDIFFLVNYLFLRGPVPHVPQSALPSGDQTPVNSSAADSITVGSVTATGNIVDVPVYVRDLAGTALGNDQAAHSHIQAFSMKVSWSPAASVASVAFTRSGITSNISPVSESRPSNATSASLVDSFQSANSIPFTSNGTMPGDVVAHLLVTLSASAPAGSTITLSLDPSVTMLANQAGTIEESAERGSLALVDGGISVPVQGFAHPPSGGSLQASSSSVIPRASAMNAGASVLNGDTPRPRIFPSDTSVTAGVRRSPMAKSYLTTTNHDAAMTYDAAGDVTVDDQGRIITYDALSMTTGISLPLPGETTTRNFLDIYTADDERIALVERLASGDTKARWTLRGLDNRALRTWTDSASGSSHTWGWSEDEIFAGPSLLAYVSSSGIRDYGVDHLGSTVALTDPNGRLIGNVYYDAFGAGGATGAGMLQYTGHERDGLNVGAQTGSVRLPDYLHARNYDPLRGRFLSVDRVGGIAGNPQSWNRYAYGRNSPIVMVDPDGNLAFPWHLAISYVAARHEGMSVRSSISLAFRVGWVDFRRHSQSDRSQFTNIHGMIGIGPDGALQTSDQARAGTVASLADSLARGDLAAAVHTAQDTPVPLHNGHVWPGSYLRLGLGAAIAHFIGDLFPTPTTVRDAYAGSLSVLEDASEAESSAEPDIASYRAAIFNTMQPSMHLWSLEGQSFYLEGVYFSAGEYSRYRP
ncbi:MAG TPA: RHS repeat-associated core domain-containing protein [Thermoanaerobaculia bacterium]|jgi:RHS repeat-associated protein|nr:RHS repeat-associated core domain-containing protein [Thermoanaerobaculia bacterium]